MGPALNLTPTEERLKKLLLAVASHDDGSLSSEREAKADHEDPMTLRFTGGWVRDKLLGITSHDIDIAISNMTGYQYCVKLKKMLEDPKAVEQHNNIQVEGSKAGEALVGNLHKIEANPEKSKHLETVTTNIMGLDIDFVNLRKETYTSTSRIPHMEFGTPKEDALRRDATINALFYNLHTSVVEDFTGKGLDDLEARIIRTPLEPYQTFEDDPLRVLRLIRFASRLDYRLDVAARTAMANPTIQEALRNKISRERIGTELEKMLKGNNPVSALELIDQLELYSTIYTDLGSLHNIQPDTSRWKDGYHFLHKLSSIPDEVEGSPIQTLNNFLLRDSGEKYHAWVLASLLPWGPLGTRPEASSGSKTRSSPPVRVAREGIKATSKTVDIVSLAFQNAREISSLCRNAKTAINETNQSMQPGNANDRAALGLTIRRWGPSWRLQVMLSLLLDVSGLFDNIAPKQDTQTLLRDYAAFVNDIESQGLLEACSLKPVIDGKTLMKTLALKPGPKVKTILDAVIEWQLASPDNSRSEDALTMIKSRKNEFLIP